MYVTTLQIYDDGKRRDERLLDGDRGTEQAMRHMLHFAQRDIASPDVRKFVIRHITGGVSSHDQEEQVKRCFYYARDNVVYTNDPYNVERVADIWSIHFALNPDPKSDAEGDCGLKSQVLVTSLGVLGFAPEFVSIKQTPQDNGFTHVYVATYLRGRRIGLDPTPANERPGWQPRASQVKVYPVFR